jgi:hypothetical protein
MEAKENESVLIETILWHVDPGSLMLIALRKIFYA